MTKFIRNLIAAKSAPAKPRRRALGTNLQVTALEDRSLMSSYYSFAMSGANFDYDINGMPDFDQRRQASATVAGLPSNGGMYCGPTAATNVMGFLANHGYSGLMPGLGNKPWQTANYNTVTNDIAWMGAVMSTDAADGTSGSGMRNGLQMWLDAFAPGKFDVIGGAPSYNFSLADAMAGWASTGALVMPVYGRYTDIGGGNYVRTGGHVLTLTDLTGQAGPLQPKTIGWRDPARYGSESEDKFSQSTFDTDTYALSGTFAAINGDIRYMERVVGLSGNNFLDGYYAVVPKSASVMPGSFVNAAVLSMSSYLAYVGNSEDTVPSAGPSVDAGVWISPLAAQLTLRHDDSAPVHATNMDTDDGMNSLYVGPMVDQEDAEDLDFVSVGAAIKTAKGVWLPGDIVAW